MSLREGGAGTGNICMMEGFRKVNFHVQIRISVFHPWVKKIPWCRKWQTAVVFLPGKFHRQRSLSGYSPSSCKESNTTEQARLFQIVSKIENLEI